MICSLLNLVLRTFVRLRRVGLYRKLVTFRGARRLQWPGKGMGFNGGGRGSSLIVASCLETNDA